MEQPRFPTNDKRDADIHRVAHETVETFDDEDFSRRDRRGCPAVNQREASERGVEIDRDPDGDDGHRRPFFSAGHRYRIPP